MASMPANIELPPYDTNGRGTPVTGMMPRHMPMFWKAWKPNQQAMPGGGHPAEDVVAVRGDRQRAPDHDAEQADQQAGADQAELLAGDGEDEVGVLLGHEPGAGLRAVEEALPKRPPLPTAIRACSTL